MELVIIVFPLQVELETKREITFSQILKKSKCLSNGLKCQGIQHGDVVAICSENNIDYCWVVLGALQAGASCALLSPTYTPSKFTQKYFESLNFMFKLPDRWH